MALSFLYRLVRCVLELIRVRRMDALAKHVEILVLRHQLSVLLRQVKRPKPTWSDRALVALFSRLVPRKRWRAFVVTPATILDWHRRLVRRRWTYPSSRPGRPPLPEETGELVLRLAVENSRWGYLRIVGELRKFGVFVSATSVRNVLRRAGLRPAPRRNGPSWTEFLSAQAKGILATDFLTVDTRDRDAKFTPPFDAVFASVGAAVIRTPVRAPRANAFAERWVRTARRECLDLLLIFSRRHLERVLRTYVCHYNEARPHRGIELAVPLREEPLPPPRLDAPVVRRGLLGGILHEYARAA